MKGKVVTKRASLDLESCYLNGGLNVKDECVGEASEKHA